MKETIMINKRNIIKVVASALAAISIASLGSAIIPAQDVSANLSVQTVIKIAEAEVGYYEKASDKDLYSKTANTSARNNYTKYGKELANTFYDWNSTQTAWCDAFVDWCFVKAYGMETAKAMTYQTPYGSAYCQTSLSYYKNNGHYYKKGNNPQKGDQIFIYDSNYEVNHTGLVVDVNMTTREVTYIDGNSGDKTDHVDKKTRSFDYWSIAGYGRPDFIYGGAKSAPNQIPTTTITDGSREYVATLYKKVLGRNASQDEINGWARNLSNGGMTAAQVAKGFYESQEYKNKRTTNAGYVDSLYQSLLGRNPDPSGRAYWISCLNNGWSRTQVLRGITGSDEFKNRCKNSYGITPGSI